MRENLPFQPKTEPLNKILPLLQPYVSRILALFKINSISTVSSTVFSTDFVLSVASSSTFLIQFQLFIF